MVVLVVATALDGDVWKSRLWKIQAVQIVAYQKAVENKYRISLENANRLMVNGLQDLAAFSHLQIQQSRVFHSHNSS